MSKLGHSGIGFRTKEKTRMEWTYRSKLTWTWKIKLTTHLKMEVDTWLEVRLLLLKTRSLGQELKLQELGTQ